jgi:hypothetical protein
VGAAAFATLAFLATSTTKPPLANSSVLGHIGFDPHNHWLVDEVIDFVEAAASIVFIFGNELWEKNFSPPLHGLEKDVPIRRKHV